MTRGQLEFWWVDTLRCLNLGNSSFASPPVSSCTSWCCTFATCTRYWITPLQCHVRKICAAVTGYTLIWQYEGKTWQIMGYSNFGQTLLRHRMNGRLLQAFLLIQGKSSHLTFQSPWWPPNPLLIHNNYSPIKLAINWGIVGGSSHLLSRWYIPGSKWDKKGYNPLTTGVNYIYKTCLLSGMNHQVLTTF